MTRQRGRPRTRQRVGNIPLLLPLLVALLAPPPAAACCDPATVVTAFAFCASACCADNGVCAPRLLDPPAAAMDVSANFRPATVGSSVPTVFPVALRGPLTAPSPPSQAPAAPHLRDIPLLV